MDNTNDKFESKLMFAIIIAGLIFFLILAAIAAKAQPNQIEGRFIYHPKQEKFTDTDGYGGGLELTTNLGNHIKLLQNFSVTKTLNGDAIQNFQQRDISLQSTVRLYPTESYLSIKPFVQGGLRVRNTKFSSSALILLPGDPGEVSTENKFTFTSPFIGAGFNIKDLYTLEYSYLLPDFTSKLLSPGFADIKAVNGLYRERGHALRAKAFLPVGRRFSFNPSYELNYTRFEFTDFKYDHTLSFGLGYRFGNEAIVTIDAQPRIK